MPLSAWIDFIKVCRDQYGSTRELELGVIRAYAKPGLSGHFLCHQLVEDRSIYNTTPQDCRCIHGGPYLCRSYGHIDRWSWRVS